ncbi:MAG: MFS transporter [Deltaproteobacteria bacterium]|nr:MFS transporter [Deltaproteobacteria bacterium]
MAGPSIFRVLRHRNFRLYWAGQGVSLVGTWMQVMAQGWVLTGLSPEAWALGAFNVAGSLPMLLLGARGGELADRRDKRVILLWTQLCMMALSLGFALLVASGALLLWHVLLFGAVASVVEAFEFPAAQGFAPELVDKEDIPAAVAMVQTVFQGARLVGPALAGLAIKHLGEASAFVFNGLSFLAVIGCLLAIRRPPARPAGEPGAPPRFSEGWRYVRNDGVTGALLGLMVLGMVLVFPFMVMMPHLGRHVLGADAAGMGDLLSASGVGAVVGSVLLLRLPAESWRPRLAATVVVLAGSLFALAHVHALTGALVVVGALSGAMAVLMGSVNQTVQARVPAELRGRVTAVFGMAFTSVLPFSAMALSLAADAVGMALLLQGCAGLFLLAGAAVLTAAHRARD